MISNEAAMSRRVNSPAQVLFASLIGTTIEFFDFYIYATAAVLVFPRLFFPSADPASARLASLATFAVAFFAAWLFFFASGGGDATQGALRHELQLFIGAVFAGYFLWCWLRGGQTLAMKAWKIRLVDVTPGRALVRFLFALVFVPTGVSILWAIFDHERQFLHDRLARTRLLDARPTTSSALPT